MKNNHSSRNGQYNKKEMFDHMAMKQGGECLKTNTFDLCVKKLPGSAETPKFLPETLPIHSLKNIP
jgi:hypothetical protein